MGTHPLPTRLQALLSKKLKARRTEILLRRARIEQQKWEQEDRDWRQYLRRMKED